MNKKAIILVIIAVFIGIYFISAMKNTAPVEVVNAPDWMSITKAQEEAREQEKLILVDVFEVGCKYCRAMEREVYRFYCPCCT